MKINVKLSLLSLMLFSVNSYSQPSVDSQPAVNSNVSIDGATSEAKSTTPKDVQAPSRDLTSQEDTVILQTLNSEISKSPVLAKLGVTVSVVNGLVSLSGMVNSDSEASSLVQVAQSIVGVKDVNADKLKVKDSSQPFQDMLITAKVKGLFIREDVFGNKDIPSMNLSIETKNGVVYLTGIIENKTQLENAKKLVESVAGVKKVEYILKQVTPK